MSPKTLIGTLALAALLLSPTASAASTESDADAGRWNCGDASDLLYDECVLVATIVTAACVYVTHDPGRGPK